MNNSSIGSSHKVNDISYRINTIYNSMIAVSTSMIIASIISAIGAMVWLHNLSFSTAPKEPAYNIGAWTGLIGGILVVILGIISISLFIYSIILQKQLKNATAHSTKRKVSLYLFIASWLPPIIVILIELFRSL